MIYRQKLYALRESCQTYESLLPVVKITKSEEAAHIARQLWDADSLSIFESAYLLCVNKANEPAGWVLLSCGGMAGTVVDIKILLTHSLLCGAAGVFLFHNHPSGSLEPSQADKDITKRVNDACKLLDITLLDHIILSPVENMYYSFSDHFLIF